VVATTRDASPSSAAATVTTTTGGSSGTVVAASNAGGALTTGEIYKNASPGVVDLKVDASAEGSGFVVDAKGDVVTNYHVVEGAKTIKVTFADARSAAAR